MHSSRAALYATIGFLGIVAAAAGGVIVAAVGGAPLGPDQAWNRLLAAHQLPALEALGGVLDVVGGSLWMTAVTVVIVAILLARRRWAGALAIAATLLLATVLSQTLKALVDRPRPLDATLSLVDRSYPSGHTTAAAALAVALLIAFPGVPARVFASVWVPLMALSRTYLLVHWATDVAAGALLGASAALAVAGTVALLDGRRRRGLALGVLL